MQTFTFSASEEKLESKVSIGASWLGGEGGGRGGGGNGPCMIKITSQWEAVELT